jgi:hypothetical protein
LVHPSTRNYSLKIFKKIFPYIKKPERKTFMDVVSLIYLHLKPQLNEENWLNGTKTEFSLSNEEQEDEIKEEEEKQTKNEDKLFEIEKEKDLSQYISELMNSVQIDPSFEENMNSFLDNEVFSNPQAKSLLRYDSVEDLLKNI